MTTQPQPTPGPWKIAPRLTDKRTMSPAIADAEDQPICYLAANGNVEIEMVYARLIAAAPDLYRNLVGLLAWIDAAKRQDAEAWKAWLPEESYLESARIALARAEGKEN